MPLPHGAVGWSAVCDCGIFLPYSLFVSNVTSFVSQTPMYKAYNRELYILVRGSGSTVIRFSAAFILLITVSNESILEKYTKHKVQINMGV